MLLLSIYVLSARVGGKSIGDTVHLNLKPSTVCQYVCMGTGLTIRLLTLFC